MPESADLNLDEQKRRGRRRLIGAIVLALAAAVLVPMLLESDPKPLGDEVAVKIPPVDDGKFVNRLTDPKTKSAAAKSDAAKAMAAKSEIAKADAAKSEALKAEPQNADLQAATPAKAEPPPADPPKAESAPAAATIPPPKKSLAEAEQRVLAPNAKAPPPARPQEARTPAPEPKPVIVAQAAPAPAPAAATAAAGSFVVQLGSFADDKGANAHSNKLKKVGYTAYTEAYVTSRGTLWRVRVGPFPTRDAAVATLDQLKSEGRSGIVMTQ